MDQLLSQLPLAQRIPALADGIRSARAHKAQLDRDEAELMALLRQAEQELKGNPAAEGIEPSGLVEPPSEKPTRHIGGPEHAEHVAQTATKKAKG